MMRGPRQHGFGAVDWRAYGAMAEKTTDIAGGRGLRKGWPPQFRGSVLGGQTVWAMCVSVRRPLRQASLLYSAAAVGY